MMRMKVVWSKRAARAVAEQIVWYEANRSSSFSETFRRNISSSVDAIAAMPSIGHFLKEERGRTYRSFVSHPRCTIYYWYDVQKLNIAHLRFSGTRQ